MDLLFQAILILTILKYCCKAGFLSHWRGIVAFALFVAVVALIFYPFIIKMDSNVFEKILQNKDDVLNIAVLTTIEAIMGILISIGMLKNLFSPKKQKWIMILKLTPGILIIGAVFYIELLVFKTFAGGDFFTLASLTASGLFLGVLMVSLGLKYLLPENASRYELKFLINLLLLIFAILLNAGLADYNTGNYQANPEFAKLTVFTGITAVGFVFGFLLFKNKNILKRKKR